MELLRRHRHPLDRFVQLHLGEPAGHRSRHLLHRRQEPHMGDHHAVQHRPGPAAVRLADLHGRLLREGDRRHSDAAARVGHLRLHRGPVEKRRAHAQHRLRIRALLLQGVPQVGVQRRGQPLLQPQQDSRPEGPEPDPQLHDGHPARRGPADQHALRLRGGGHLPERRGDPQPPDDLRPQRQPRELLLGTGGRAGRHPLQGPERRRDHRHGPRPGGAGRSQPRLPLFVQPRGPLEGLRPDGLLPGRLRRRGMEHGRTGLPVLQRLQHRGG